MVDVNRYYMIENAGEVEESAFTLMGVSTKEGPNKIGYFGSGNKYAIACALRNGIDVTVFSGETELEFTTESIEFRGGEYDRILVNGNPTSLTTRMGPDWKDWFILREFVANAKDEGGYRSEITAEEPCGCAGVTRIYLGMPGDFSDLVKNMEDKILPQEHECVWEGDHGRILPATSSKENFFRMGISIVGEPNGEALYWYDFDSIDISESRVYQYRFQVNERMAALLMQCDDESVIHNVVHHAHGKVEWNADYQDSGAKFSWVWHDYLKDKRLCSESIYGVLDTELKMHMLMIPDGMATALRAQWEDLDIYGKNSSNYVIIPGTEEQIERVESARRSLERIGYKISTPVEFVRPVSSGVMALYDDEAKIIGINPETMGDNLELQSTLLEEHFHTEGYRDGSRDFENHLMKLLIKASDKAVKIDKLLDLINGL